MRHLLILFGFFFLCSNNVLSQCSCTDCPIFLASNTTETSEIDVSGLVNGTLGVAGQGVCGISINFNTDAVDELTFSVTAPDGSMIDLFVQTGLSSGQDITYDILFLPCSEVPMPDAGFSPQFDSSEPWVAGSFYSGTYHPSFDCLEDFTGSANGTWTLTMTDFISIDDSNLFDWELIFCDGTGTDCGSEPSCEADAGMIEIDPSEFCEGDPALDFNLNPTYTGDAPDALLYGYQYVISDMDGNVIEFTDDPDLTAFTTGNYTICGMSYLLTEQAIINVLPNTISDIENNIANFVYCADLFCVDIDIAEDFLDVIMDWDGIDLLCANQDYTFSVVNFDPAYDYVILVNSGIFNSVNIVNGSITINPASGSPIVEICVSINDDCIANEICKQFDVIGNDDPLILDFPTEVCVENSFDIFILNIPPADGYSWTISGPGVFDSQDAISAQISPTGTGIITVCITPSTIECGDGVEECIDIEIKDPPPPGIIADLTVCLPGGNLTADVFSPLSTVEWSVISGPGSFQILNPFAISTNYTVDLPGTYEIQLTENTGECERINTAFIEVLEPIEILIDNVCNNGEYTTTVTFVNGTAPYFIDGTQIAGNTFVFGPTASGSSFSFSYSDVNLCTEVESTSEDCPCVSESGTMDETPINVCGDQEIMGIHNGDEFLDNNDAGQYILTSSSINPTNTIIQVSDDGSFNFEPPLNYNTTYYIFYIVGDASGSSVDLFDPCLSASNFQTVTWHEPPVITMPDDFSTCDFEVDVDVLSSIPVNSEWILIASPAGSIAVIANPNSLSTEISFTLPGVYVFEYTATTTFCTVVEQLEIEIFPPIDVSSILELCDGLNYTVSFEIAAGAPPFNINGTVIFSTFYQSEPIPSGSTYDFIITDNNGCMYTDLFGQKNCECDSDAGTMSQDLIEVCPTTASVQGVFNNNANLEPDDVGIFILHEGLGIDIVNILDSNSLGVFNFQPALMNVGQTYYISYIVGNDDGNEGVDLSDPCLDVTPGQPVLWNAPPISLLNQSYFICTDTLTLLDNEISNDYSNVQWTLLDGPTDGTLNIAIPSANEYILIVNKTGTYEVEAEIINDDCSTRDTIEIINNKISLTDISYQCDSLTGNYTALIHWEGGSAPFYIGNDTIIIREYEIVDIESGMPFEINIIDSLSCRLNNITGSTVCDCFPPEHTMNPDTLSTCDTTLIFQVSATTIGTISNEDAGTYILHTESIDSLGVEIQSNPDGQFMFSNMELDIIYYISYVSGDSLLDGSVNLNDPCISVSFGQPIVYYSTPITEAGEDRSICGISESLLGASNAESVEWQIIESVSGSTPLIDNFESLNAEFTTDLSGEYVLTLEGISNGCSSIDTLRIFFFEPISVTSVDEICSEDNSAYTVEFQISGGQPPYIVNGTQLVGDSYQSEDIPNLSSYQFLIDDSGPCESVEIEGSFDCSCTSIPGDLIPGLIELCEGEDLNLEYLNDPEANVGFNAGYILHDGNLQMIGNILLITDETPIEYDIAFPLNQTLIITPFIGEGDINDIDLLASCTLFGDGIEVIWQSHSSLSFDAPDILCEGDTLIFELMLDAPSYPQQIEVNGTNFEYMGAIPDASVFSIEIPVQIGGNYTITLDGSLCLDLNTLLSFTISTENCDCSVFSFETEDILCSSETSIDLNDWVVEEGIGTWSIVSSDSNIPPIIQDNILSIENVTSGNTELAYISSEPDACDSTYMFSVFIESEFEIALLQETILLCVGTDNMLSLTDYLSDQEIAGQWIAITELPSGSFSDGNVSTTELNPGIYFFEYVLNTQPLVCPLESLIFEIEISPPIDYIITSTNPACFGEDGSLLIEILDAPSNANTITINGEIIEDPDISNLNPGEYEIILSDENLCTYLENILIEEPEELQLELEGSIESSSDGNTAIVNALSNIKFEDANITWYSNGSEIVDENDSILLLNIFGDTEISVLLEDPNGCTIEDLIVLSLVENEVDISFPNVLHLGSNSGNSIFQIPAYSDITRIEELSIYDRWGEEVFKALNYDPSAENISWDGTLNGSPVNLGVYVFKLIYLDAENERQIEYGDIAVIAN